MGALWVVELCILLLLLLLLLFHSPCKSEPNPASQGGMSASDGGTAAGNMHCGAVGKDAGSRYDVRMLRAANMGQW